MLGLSSAGVTLAGTIDASKEKIKEGGDEAMKEIEKLIVLVVTIIGI